MIPRMSFRSMLAVLVALSAAAIVAADGSAPVSKCKRDLAKRLGVKAGQIALDRAEPVVWPNAALGLPRVGEFYAEVITPGWTIVLDAQGEKYLYTASGRAVKYAGPLAGWQWSVVYIEPVPEEPNLNGNLVRVSVLGTHPSVVLGAVSDFWLQKDSSILAKRRLSRSGHELLHAPSGVDASVRLAAAFDFSAAVLSSDSARWAAVSRPRVGAPWVVTGGEVGGTERQPWSVPLPEGLNSPKLNWTSELLVAHADAVAYELASTDGDGSWREVEFYLPVDDPDLMLNKSEVVDVVTDGNTENPGTRVVRRWFTGDEKPVAELPGFVCAGLQLAPDRRFLLLTGTQDDRHHVYSVDLAGGEVIHTAAETMGPAALLPEPPAGAETFLAVLGDG